MSAERLQDLLIRGLDGNAQAYREFLSDLAGYLRSFLMRRLSSLPDEVEDLVQESLLAIHNKRHTYDRKQPLAAWVHAIARYKLVDFLRGRAIRDSLNTSLDEEDGFFSTSNTDAAEARQDIMKLLDRLPEKQRMPIIHTKLDGLSVEEAAQMSGMSESALKVGIHRGMKALAAMVGEKR
ncbi:MAG: sigma-70 family RNA polymerase sigma factor [Sulfuritalea sp.]|nr:sigma-70 family RNA polymerase sigma factor [Sulfuritalea sp.]